jgi:hypothetical protein
VVTKVTSKADNRTSHREGNTKEVNIRIIKATKTKVSNLITIMAKIITTTTEVVGGREVVIMIEADSVASGVTEEDTEEAEAEEGTNSELTSHSLLERKCVSESEGRPSLLPKFIKIN